MASEVVLTRQKIVLALLQGYASIWQKTDLLLKARRSGFYNVIDPY